MRTPDEEIADYKQVTLAEARKFYEDFYGASNAEMAVVGDFDAAAIQKLAGELFGAWKSPRPYERVITGYEKIEPANRTIEVAGQGERDVRRGRAAQSERRGSRLSGADAGQFHDRRQSQFPPDESLAA